MTLSAVLPDPPAVAAYRSVLPAGEVTAFPIQALDRFGAPQWTAAVWPETGPAQFGFGYGATDGAAMTSAFGEMAEMAAAHEGVARLERRRGSYRELRAVLGPEAVVDPLTACLEAGSPYTHDDPLTWVEARRWPESETVLVPVELVAAEPRDVGEGPFLVLPITNGLGAGPSFEHALAHGLLEILQRDGNSVNYRALDQGVVLDLDEVRDPDTRALLDRLDAEGVEVMAKLAATDFGMVDLYVVGHDREVGRSRHPLMLSGCGEAAHPDRERALGKALREFLSSRARKPFSHGPLALAAEVAPEAYLERVRGRSLDGEEPRALRAMLDWLALDHQGMHDLLADPVWRAERHVAFSSLPTVAPPEVADPADLLATVAGRLRDAGFDVLWVDLSPPGGEAVVTRAVVPGLEVETVSYGRIGERNLGRLLERGSPLVGIGPPPAAGRPIPLPEAAEERLGGPAYLDQDALERTVGRLYPLYREPGRHAAAVAGEPAER